METVKLYSGSDQQSLQNLLTRYTLEVIKVNSGDIPGSFWGDSEAGIISNKLYVRDDTPIHSLMHEACHFICMDQQRRDNLDSDAEGDYDEENGVCYLQILLADLISGYSSKQMCKDMDLWGYTFRLGSAKKWFDNDAEDALNWLKKANLVNKDDAITWKLRETNL